MSTTAVFSQNNFVTRINATNLVQRSLKLLQSKIKPGAKLLDIGTGDGAVTMQSFVGKSEIKFSKVIGCDINPDHVKFANEKYKNSVVSFEVFDVLKDVPEVIKASAPFDVMSSFHCFHWMTLEELKKPILNLKPLLKENGNFYFFYPINLCPPNLEEGLLKKYPQGTPAIPMFTSFTKDEEYLNGLRAFLSDEGFKFDLYEIATLKYTYGTGELKGLFSGILPFLHEKEQQEADKLANDMVEIFEANNERVTGDPKTHSLDYIHCFATLSK